MADIRRVERVQTSLVRPPIADETVTYVLTIMPMAARARRDLRIVWIHLDGATWACDFADGRREELIWVAVPHNDPFVHNLSSLAFHTDSSLDKATIEAVTTRVLQALSEENQRVVFHVSEFTRHSSK